MAPVITPAKVVERDTGLQECVKTDVHIRPVRVEETRRSYDYQGRASDRTTFWNETHAQVDRYTSHEWANFAICETADGTRCRFSTDAVKLPIGETVYIVLHQALGFAAIDIAPSPVRGKGFYTEIVVPPIMRLAPWLALAAGLFDFYLHASPQSAVLIALATGLATHAVLSSARWLRTRLIILSRKRASRAIRHMHTTPAA